MISQHLTTELWPAGKGVYDVLQILDLEVRGIADDEIAKLFNSIEGRLKPHLPFLHDHVLLPAIKPIPIEMLYSKLLFTHDIENSVVKKFAAPLSIFAWSSLSPSTNAFMPCELRYFQEIIYIN